MSPLSGLDLTPAPSLIVGRSIVLSLTSLSANSDPGAIDEVTAIVRTSTGDSEALRFLESGPNTGVFLAVVETVRSPPAPLSGDCRLSVTADSNLTIDILDRTGSAPLASHSLKIMVDPLGAAFDSRNGSEIAAVKVSLVDASSGQAAIVYGDDGVSSYPSTVVTGQSVSDSGGTVYAYARGDYRFPLVAPGNYRLLVEPASPYSFPSARSPEQLSALHRAGGEPYVITSASFGQKFTVTSAGSVKTDLPLDRPVTPLVIAKSVNRAEAQRGDFINYQVAIRNPGADSTGPITVDDRIPEQMRFHPGSARLGRLTVDEPAPVADRVLRFTLPPLPSGAQEILNYVLEVRPNAQSGDAVNEAQAKSDMALSNVSDAVVRIRNDDIAERVTIIGRVLGGGCTAEGSVAIGVPGIRIMLEDGSYAVTDHEGRYHFEGLKTGTHVVQLDRATIPDGAEAVDCAADVRSGGRPTSRFVEGLGGELKRIDFWLAPSAEASRHGAPAAIASVEPRERAEPPLSDAAAAGGDRDWLAGQTPGIDFLFPTRDVNPRSPVTRVAVKHFPGQKVALFLDGKPADPIAFEGTQKAVAGDVAVSVWRGIPLARRSTELRAEISDSSGAPVKTLRRTVLFANAPAHVEIIRQRSILLADGVHRPMLALRITDRGGIPVHAGMAGEFELPEPYYPAMEADAQQARQLAGLERARPTWHVVGDDGMAYVELEPTTASGTVSIRFSFRDGESVREQRLEAWLSPGERPWTIVGLAEGTVGFSRLDAHLERLGPISSNKLVEGRIALYAKGRVLGRWLLTLSYDTDKHRQDQTFGGVIDPQLYYTVYADRSERRYDASSIRKLYLRLERPQFYALFGDYNTAIDEPVLSRYVRSFNGAKAEYRSNNVAATVYATDTPLTHRREEIQGSGLSGPYALKAKPILANSERVTLQTRDRFRSEVIIGEKILTRHVDYDINYERGTLVFHSPVLSRSSSLNPQFIIAEYDVDGIARSVVDAGARVTWKSSNQRVQAGATVIHDNDGHARRDLAGVDIKVRATPTTELRAEVAVTRADVSAGSNETAGAWLVQVEHHGRKLDALAYAGQRGVRFGVDQTNTSENGMRKIGADLRWHANDNLSLSASLWRHLMIDSSATSEAVRVLAEFRSADLSTHAGFTLARDRLANGAINDSTLLNLGASKQFAHGRVDLGVDSEIPIGGSGGTVNFPQRHRLTARVAVTRWASLIGSYEIAKGDAVDARTARLGFDLAPWAGAKIEVSGNVQDIPEYGRRSFAAFGLAQSIVLSKNWSFDASLDSNRTIGGIDPASVVERLQPVASGGFVGDKSVLTEDFTAVTAGATYRSGRLSLTGRAEYRNGEKEDRTGLTLGAIRQIGEGRALAGRLAWFRATGRDGSVTSVANSNLTWANRPADRALTWLDKLELRRDEVAGAVAGSTDPLGNPLSVVGDARSLRVINSLTANYSDKDNRYELSIFWGSRYVSDRFGDDDIAGWSNIVAGDARLAVGAMLEVGAAGTIRYGIGSRSAAYSFGPQVSIRPMNNSWLMLGYNFIGYTDRDFAEDRFTRSGPYITLRFKFDELSFRSLGFGGG